MSDNNLYLIPEDPTYIPASELSDQAIDILKGLVGRHDDVKASITDDIFFIDPGQNFESVSCPNCETEITDSWGTLINDFYRTSFSNLTIKSPCCGSEISINDFIYHWPAGFARYVLSAYNPSITGWLDKSQIGELENILGCKLRQVLAHI